MESTVYFALSLTIFAGLATGLGSILSLFAKHTNTKFLSASLGFSAGVMIYISMIEIFAKSRAYLEAFNAENGYMIATLSFFGGVLLIGFIDFFIPSAENDIGYIKTKDEASKLKRMGLMTAISIAIHNFPEGIATFTAALKDSHTGIAIAIAIAIHNIPEGIATSVPIYYSTNSKFKAFAVSFFSGLTEPIGAILGYLILSPFFNDRLFGILFGIVAGIMVFISVEELLPMAREYEKSKITITGFTAGMAIMALSLILFN